MSIIPFNKPYLTGNEHQYVKDAIALGQLSGDGHFTGLCKDWLERVLKPKISLLTHSCTSALEMTASLLNIVPGDEVIMPSFTFVSTANAFILRGATPVFVDVREDTLNIDENLIEQAITSKTKAIVVVHYAGISCEMDQIISLANLYKLPVIEDAAQGIMSTYKGSSLGTIGDLGAISFHDTKNLTSGEGGALFINNPIFIERAEIIRDKGTNRKKFLRGEVDKYTWIDEGSSHLPSELVSAFLFAQLENADAITKMRTEIWQKYHAGLESLENELKIIRPSVPEGIQHNGHIYYILLSDEINRDNFISAMKKKGIVCSFHYIPLHSSPAGIKWGKSKSPLVITDNISSRIVRLPLWPTINADKVLKAVYELLA